MKFQLQKLNNNILTKNYFHPILIILTNLCKKKKLIKFTLEK